MSFILDALKKAESERHRASGPVLVDVRFAPPRRGLPAWAWVLGGILLANLAALSWLMLRKPPPAAMAAASIAATAPAVAPPVVVGPALAPPQPVPGTQLDPLVPQPAQHEEFPAVPARTGAPASTAGLRTAQELKSAGVSLPQLVLNLHAWDTTPAQRYVLLNGLRLMEGEFTPDGIKVEAITEDGVVLQARGQRFLLPRGG